ncbi:MAG TPA: hypothetical protein PLP34_02210 [Chitinophagaceae bacterium]|nr:hypothetical protein [Chitinophagaceae bacterium]HNF71195.1 hypothetical protein [Chitinophagaceae bacterium]
MIFRRYYSLQSKKSAEELKSSLLGRHLKVHVLDFEVMERNGDLKIIPHAEDEDHIYTLPITRVRFSKGAQGTQVKMMSKPRRIDIGGPYLVMFFVVFAMIAGIITYAFGQGKYNNTAFILAGISLIVFALLWFRLEMGYFDYIRKIRNWLKENI